MLRKKMVLGTKAHGFISWCGQWARLWFILWLYCSLLSWNRIKDHAHREWGSLKMLLRVDHM